MASVRRYIASEKKLRDEELDHIKTQVKNEMTSSFYEETIFERNGDHEERELPAAATRKSDESSANPPMEGIVIEK